jgi:hypothetical protein
LLKALKNRNKTKLWTAIFLPAPARQPPFGDVGGAALERRGTPAALKDPPRRKRKMGRIVESQH